MRTPAFGLLALALTACGSQIMTDLPASQPAPVPDEPAARLDAWLSYGEPMIQTRLRKLRFSTAYPWLITHTQNTDGGEPEIWGLDLDTLRPARISPTTTASSSDISGSL